LTEPHADMTAGQDSLPPADRRSSAGTFLAWMVILGVASLVVGVHLKGPRPEAGEGRLGKALLEFQGRYLVGAAELLGDRAGDAVRQYLERPETAPDWQRLRVAILAGELSGPDAALERLRAMREPAQPGAAPAGAKAGASLDVLVRLYRDYSQDNPSAPSVTEEEKRLLRTKLGWFGKLALAPPGADTPLREQVISAARGTFRAVIGGVVGIGIAGLAGLFILIVFAALLFGGGLSGLAISRGHGGVYAEAFAFWLVLFLALSAAGGALLGSEAAIAVGLLSQAGSLLAIGWPLVRGVPWKRLREDLGWTMGRGPVRETLAGIGCYAMAIPLVIAAVILVSIVAGSTGDGAGAGKTPVHPIARLIAEGNWWQRAQLLLMACVAAPIVEETMFRGFFYRHLREATGSLSRWASVLLSATVSSVFFAVIHPQGLLAVPGITGLALAFAFMREWRGTLLPSVLAHALNNGVMMAILMMLLTG